MRHVWQASRECLASFRAASRAACAVLMAVGIFLTASVAPAQEGEVPVGAAAELADILARIEQLSGQFRQTLYPEEGGRATSSRGEFRLQAPGRFLWRIEAPDNQLVVSSGETLWHYDADLGTATRRPVSAVSSAPLQVLAGDSESLAQDFRVSRLGEDRFRLVPRRTDAGFQSLELTLDKGLPVALVILDNLSQRLEIFLEGLSVEAFDPSMFDFEPPENADVFIHDG
jgi:outer membrane lipoprotein carrier protein